MNHKEITDFVKDCQYLSDINNYPYCAKTQYEVHKRDYFLLKDKLPKDLRQIDFVMCRMNELLEIMRDFYVRKNYFRER